MNGLKYVIALLLLCNTFRSFVAQLGRGTASSDQCPPCAPRHTCYYLREGNGPPRLGCITMTEAILLEQAERGGPSGPGSSVPAAGLPAQRGLPPPQPQTFENIPELSTLGIGTRTPTAGRPQGFETRFQQGLGLGTMTGTGTGGLPGAGMSGLTGTGMGATGMGGFPATGMGGLPGTGMGGLPGIGMGATGMGAFPRAGMGGLPGTGMGATGMGAFPGAGMGGLPGTGMGTAGMGAFPGAGMGALAGTGMGSSTGAGMQGMTGLGFPQTAGGIPGFGMPGTQGSGFPSMSQPGLMPGRTPGMMDPITGQSVALGPPGSADGGARSSVVHAHAQSVGGMQGGGTRGQRAFPACMGSRNWCPDNYECVRIQGSLRCLRMTTNIGGPQPVSPGVFRSSETPHRVTGIDNSSRRPSRQTGTHSSQRGGSHGHAHHSPEVPPNVGHGAGFSQSVASIQDGVHGPGREGCQPCSDHQECVGDFSFCVTSDNDMCPNISTCRTFT